MDLRQAMGKHGAGGGAYMEVVSHWGRHAFERYKLPSCIPLSLILDLIESEQLCATIGSQHHVSPSAQAPRDGAK